MKILKLKDGRNIVISDREALGIIENLENKIGTHITRNGSYYTYQSIMSVENPSGLDNGEKVYYINGSLKTKNSSYDYNSGKFTRYLNEIKIPKNSKTIDEIYDNKLLLK